jgi:hypothetical protein
MKYKTTDILRLLKEVAIKTDKSLAHPHFPDMYEIMLRDSKELPFTSHDYLYRKLFLEVEGADEKRRQDISLSAVNVEAIAKFLGYKSYEQFKKFEHPERNPVLENCIDTWYSYVRCNSGSRNVFVSPVRIFANGKEIQMELRGPSRLFKGIVRLNGHALYCFMESGKEKNLHLVMKVALSDKPEVIQGVFSGISTGGDPIAGREILIRQPGKKFETLAPQKFKIDDLLKSGDEGEKKIGNYFTDKEKNILAGGKASTFGWEDLE